MCSAFDVQTTHNTSAKMVSLNHTFQPCHVLVQIKSLKDARTLSMLKTAQKGQKKGVQIRGSIRNARKFYTFK